MSQVRVDDLTKSLIQQAQVFLSELDETQYTFGETIKEVFKQWLKSVLEVYSEPDTEPISLQTLAMEIAAEVDGLL
jgi:hypothetical protein